MTEQLDQAVKHDDVTEQLDQAVKNAEYYAQQVGNTIQQIQSVKVDGKSVSLTEMISQVKITDSDDKLEEIHKNLVALQGGEKNGFLSTLGKFLPFIKEAPSVSNAKELIEQIDSGIQEKIQETERTKPVLENFSRMLSDRHRSLAELVKNLETNKVRVEEQIQEFKKYLNEQGAEHPDYLTGWDFLKRLERTLSNLDENYAAAVTTRTHIVAQSTLLNEARKNQEDSLIILKNTQQFTLRTMQDSLVIKAISDKTSANLNAIEATRKLATSTLNSVTQGVIENSKRVGELQNQEHDTKIIDDNIKALEELIQQRNTIDAQRKVLITKQVEESKALLEKLSHLLQDEGEEGNKSTEEAVPTFDLKGIELTGLKNG